MGKGAKSKLTEARIQAICKAIEIGMTQERAATLAGISKDTFYRWKSTGEKAKSGLYLTFSDSLKKANVVAEVRHLNNILKHAMGGSKIVETRTTTSANGSVTNIITKKEALGSWQASAWYLERKHPDMYGRNRITETEDNQPLPWFDDIPDPLGQY